MADHMMFHMTELTQFGWIWDKFQNWKGYFDGRLSTACIPFQGVIVLNRRWVFRHYIIAVIVWSVDGGIALPLPLRLGHDLGALPPCGAAQVPGEDASKCPNAYYES